MIRFMLRAGGMLLLAAGVAALVADGARSVSASRLLVTTVREWVALGGWTAERSPTVLVELSGFVPAFAILAVAGVLLLAAGRPRPARIGFARR